MSATFETLSHWLRSPFFDADGGETLSRAALERELRGDVRAQLQRHDRAIATRSSSRCSAARAPRAANALDGRAARD